MLSLGISNRWVVSVLHGITRFLEVTVKNKQAPVKVQLCFLHGRWTQAESVGGGCSGYFATDSRGLTTFGWVSCQVCMLPLGCGSFGNRQGISASACQPLSTIVSGRKQWHRWLQKVHMPAMMWLGLTRPGRITHGCGRGTSPISIGSFSEHLWFSQRWSETKGYQSWISIRIISLWFVPFCNWKPATPVADIILTSWNML